MSNKIEIKAPTIGFGGALTLLFIGLKLGKVIDWSWLWVLAPLWLPFAVFLALFFIIGFVIFIARVLSK